MTAVDAISGTTKPQIMNFGQASGLPQSGPDTGVMDMSFGDFLDMVNPLQHIPVVSSIYRSVTGDTINPVSRIAGDTLYGGIVGIASAGVSVLASAGIAAVGAIGDEMYAANNGGENSSGTVISALFGGEKEQAVQVAANAKKQDSQLQEMQVATMQSPPPQPPPANMSEPKSQPAMMQVAAASTPAATMAPTDPIAALQAAAASGKSLQADRAKQAYGGVMDPAMMQSAMQNQTLALALSSGQGAMQAQHALRNNRFSTVADSGVAAATPTTTMLSVLSAGGPANRSTSSVPGLPGMPAAAAAKISPVKTAQSMPLPQSLMDDSKALKGLNQYRSSAQSVPVPFVGSSVDMTN